MSEPNPSGEAHPPEPPASAAYAPEPPVSPAHAAPEAPAESRPISPAPPEPAPRQPAPFQPAPPQPAPAAQPAHAAPDLPVFAPGSASVSTPTSPAGGYGEPASGDAATPAEPTISMAGGQYPAPQQYASPPVSGTPYVDPAYAGAPPDPAAGKQRRGPAFLVVTIVAVLLFLAAGAMTALYVTKTGELNKTKRDLTAQVSQRDTKINEQTSEIDRLKKDVQATKDEVEKVKQDLSGTQNAAEELKRQKAVISKCLNLLGEAGYLADQGQTAQARAKLNEAQPVCNEAERYLE